MKILSLTLAGVALSGCLLGGEEDVNGNSLRSYSGRTYTDHELGYRLTFPSGWVVQAVPEAGYGLLDFVGVSRLSKFGEPSASAWHLLAFDDETLRSWVESQYSSSYPDSSRIFPVEIRNGVEVIPVDTWIYGAWYTEKNRVLHFIRNGQKVTLNLRHFAANFDSSAEMRFLDSSLTFF